MGEMGIWGEGKSRLVSVVVGECKKDSTFESSLFLAF